MFGVVPQNSARIFSNPAPILRKPLVKELLQDNKGRSVVELGAGCLRNALHLQELGFWVSVLEVGGMEERFPFQYRVTLNGSMPTYHHSDHLLVRVNTNSSGTTVGQQGHYPFGESWYASSTTTKWQFTSCERHSESGLDFFLICASGLGNQRPGCSREVCQKACSLPFPKRLKILEMR